MRKKLFLIGDSGCGKSTMICGSLGNSMEHAGGFVTFRVRDGCGRAVGYDLAPASYAAGAKSSAPQRFLDLSASPVRVIPDVFKVYGTELLKKAAGYDFSVCDEFGGFDLAVPEFRNALADFVSSGSPCIGVFKGTANASQLSETLCLGDSLEAYRREIYDLMLRRDDILLLRTTGRYDAEAHETVADWVRQYAL